MSRKSFLSFWLEAIGVIVGGYSLFSLTQSIFEFGLTEFFGRLTDVYRGVFHPIMRVAEPPLEWLAMRLGWSLPVSWPDFGIFYLVIAGATARVHARPGGRMPAAFRIAAALLHGLLWLALLMALPIAIALNKKRGSTFRASLSHYWDILLQIAYAFTALFAFLALNAIG